MKPALDIMAVELTIVPLLRLASLEVPALVRPLVRRFVLRKVARHQSFALQVFPTFSLTLFQSCFQVLGPVQVALLKRSLIRP
jgi:hypothetical protein